MTVNNRADVGDWDCVPIKNDGSKHTLGQPIAFLLTGCRIVSLETVATVLVANGIALTRNNIPKLFLFVSGFFENAGDDNRFA